MRRIFLALVLSLTARAHAGFVELGASANYRSSGYDANNFIQSLTYTATLSYYFWEMCAWEANYTNGYSKEVTKGIAQIDPRETIQDNIDMASLDLVLSLAERQDAFRPYIKLGAGYLVKDRYRKVNDDDTELISHQEGLVPSAGLGLSFGLTQNFNIKVGVEAWSSPPSQRPIIIDYAGRAGVSWIF